MTVEEAYNYLTSPSYCTIDCDNCSNCCDACDVNASLNLAVKALEKQIPKRPKIEDMHFSKIELCPTCDSLDIIDSGDMYNNKYCPNCGQAIDWGD